MFTDFRDINIFKKIKTKKTLNKMISVVHDYLFILRNATNNWPGHMF